MNREPVFVPVEGVIPARLPGPALPESVGQPASMVVTVDGVARQVLEQARTRLVVVGALFALALSVVAVRLVSLAVIAGTEPGAEARISPPAEKPVRADILDRNGKVLATSIATASLYADPAKVIDAPEAARQLNKLFPEVSYGEFLQKLQGKGRFAWLKRHLTPRQQYEVNRLGIPGVGFEHDERRLYPEGSEIAQVIGYADVDNHGIAGIEQSFDSYLARGADPLKLSIDIRLQHILHREVQQQIDTFNAKGGGGLIMDTNTGEILAMVSLPDFDPEQPGAQVAKTEPGEPDPHFNRMTLGVYEMGSIFKVFNTALCLDSGKVKLTDYFDAAHPIHIGRFTIHDFKGDELPGYASVAEIFEKSSNIGSVQEVKQVGPEAQEHFMEKLGLTTKIKLEVPEVGTPEIPHPWRPVNMMTIAFGHGISVTPVQLVRAISAIADGGILRPATLIKRPDGEPVPGVRVISPETSDTMRRLMRLVVTGGTAKQFGNVPGYLVGGKTGTAEKISARGAYTKHHANLSSFVALFPMTDPRYAVFVTIDEPHGNKQSAGYETGGWVAAPAASRVISAMGPLLGVPPVDEASPTVQAKMEIDVNPNGRRIASD
ncbi:MAG TPA: penicillin-binding protein 2 [Alphaproteobacteria bacterium]|nr:penicillin-binding protein 2 [Alphaproteobacteria bacterium]